MMNTDIMTAARILEIQYDRIYGRPQDYIRAQVETEYGMDTVDEASIKGLVAEGDRLWEKYADRLREMVRAMLDERYGGQ